MAKVDRLETLIQRVASDILMNEVKEELGFVTITGAKVTNELSFMYLYYTVFGDEAQVRKTHEALERAKGFIRSQIGHRVKMRKVPELVFKYDTSEATGRKIDSLIHNSAK